MVKKLILISVLLTAGIGYAGYHYASFLITCSGCSSAKNPKWAFQGPTNVVTQRRAVSGFSAIHVAGPAEVVVDRVGSESLALIADDNLLPFLSAEVKDGVLYLGFANDQAFDGKVVRYRVSAANLRDIEVSGSSDVTVNNVDSAALSVTIAGTGDVQLAGHTDDLRISVSSSGIVNAIMLKSTNATVWASTHASCMTSPGITRLGHSTII
jgi:hypothetical protein